jgi:hypothetical protein
MLVDKNEENRQYRKKNVGRGLAKVYYHRVSPASKRPYAYSISFILFATRLS